MQPSGTVQPEDVPGPIAREPALAQVAVDMLRAHDRSVESLSWRQVIEAGPLGTQVPAPTAPAAVAARVPEDRALGFRASSTEPPAATRTRVAALWSEIDVDRLAGC